MSSMNRVTLMGNLTRDPVLRNIGATAVVGEFGMAITEVVMSKDREKEERVCFVEIVTWNAQAKSCGEYLKKGSRVLVEGKLQLEEWTDKTSGEKKSRLKVRAERVHFIGSPARSQTGGGEPAAEERPLPPQQPPPVRGRPQRSPAHEPEMAMHGD